MLKFQTPKNPSNNIIFERFSTFEMEKFSSAFGRKKSVDNKGGLVAKGGGLVARNTPDRVELGTTDRFPRNQDSQLSCDYYVRVLGSKFHETIAKYTSKSSFLAKISF